METLDVLLIEDRPGAATDDADALEAAGHRVHRCFDHSDRSAPCRVLDGQPCPVDGGLDVALVVRRGVVTRPTPYEAGVSCALRAGVPLVEDGTDERDPYTRFLSGRVTGDPVAECEAVVERSRARLRDEMRGLVATLAAAGGLDEMLDHGPGAFDLEEEGSRHHLRLTIVGPDVPTRFRNRLAVRLLDVARRHRPSGAQVDVGYRVA